MSIYDLFNLLSALFLLLYGMKLVSDNMKMLAGDKLRTSLSFLTANRIAGLFTGAVATAFLQSSSATTVILISLVSSGLVTFTASLGVILGADIGTTLTVQLIALNVYDYALVITGIGALMRMVYSAPHMIQLGRIIFGFGLIFLGMKFMSLAVEPLKQNPELLAHLVDHGGSGLTLLLLAFVFTAVVQASAATIALALSLASSGIIDLHQGMLIVLGANIGTCITAIFASIGANVAAKKTATAHILFKILGAILCYPFLATIEQGILGSGDVLRNIAHFHTLFNIGVALVFLPLITPVAKFIEWLFHRYEEPALAASPKLDRMMLTHPDLALDQAHRIVLQMSDHCRQMLNDTFEQIENYHGGRQERIAATDDILDAMNLEIRLYLAELSRRELTGVDAKRMFDILHYATVLENAGDVMVKNVSKLTAKLARSNGHLSPEGLQEIRDFYHKVRENFELCQELYLEKDPLIAAKLRRHYSHLQELEHYLLRTHMERLYAGTANSLATTTVHTDLLTNFERINSYFCRFQLDYNLQESST
ncbi:Na/Pi cotransporter family protein [Chrysiogenes arsenatis]|uniref:Na/Pi cotransporter family protein n=1 Tax=Chrysiogenes arsenatis TaxID=309797 RepID=UPI00040EB4E0|nr:Na/Pi cotransporter family protein [Chrysiogenes arsenatis]